MITKQNSSGGLSSKIKDRLIQQVVERRMRSLEDALSHDGSPAQGRSPILGPKSPIPEDWIRWDRLPGFKRISMLMDGAKKLGVESPFFTQHEGLAGAKIKVGGKLLLNFSSYNYLGLCGHPEVDAAAVSAIRDYGTSVCASRIVSGERSIHRELEKELAAAYKAEDCLVFVSGHATSVTAIGCLFGPKDLIVHDSLIHNCAVEGAKLSGAKRLSFPHNDWAALDRLLEGTRKNYERVLIVIEGLYSMDGDLPELPEFIRIKKKHHAFLMVDEAHSFGVVGDTGMGVREYFDIESSSVDLWMGTLSKALAGCGGYIAGSKDLIKYLKYSAPGFVYSVGMSPPLCAASLAALRLLKKELRRVHRLQQRGMQFLQSATAKGLPTGLSEGYSIVPIITASSIKAARLSQELANQGIAVQPILYPAVAENSARLRFFVSSDHSENDISQAVETLFRIFGKY
jgi:8-amino-7-oxononanoate synthase